MVTLIIRVLWCASIMLLGMRELCAAQQCNTLLSFNGSTINFTKCVTLPTQNSILAWNFHEENSTLALAFHGFAPSNNGWVGWGINPLTASQMVGTSALIAFQSARNGSNILPYKLTREVQGLQVPLTCTPVDLVIQATAVEIQGTSMRLFVVLQLQPNKTILHHVWNRGPIVLNFQPQQHSLSVEDLHGYQTIDMSTAQILEVGGPPYYSLKRAHGIINTISWGILLPLGAIFARYLRRVPALEKAWFYMHVPCQVLGYSLGTTGWALGMKLWVVSSVIHTTHQNIGITLFAVATLQVLALLYHPKQDKKYRKYWNVYHHGLGYAIILLAVFNIFLGLNILDPGGIWRPGYIASLSFLAMVALLLEIRTWIYRIKKNHG